MAKSAAPAKPKSKNNASLKFEDLQLRKIQVFFKRSTLKTIMKILTMKHAGFRSVKTVKNINRLFNSLDESLYKQQEELMAYLWCIRYFSKKYLDGFIDVDLIAEGAKREPDYDNVKAGIIDSCLKDAAIVSEAEAKLIFGMISEALQFGYLSSVKTEYENLLSDISFDHVGAFKELADRLFEISHSMLDIKHSTSFVTNTVTFNTDDPESIREAVSRTQASLQQSTGVFKTGIRRWNTLLSPGYMNGRLYTYLGLPGSFKSGVLLKSALDIRKYNPGWQPKTPGMKPCVLYITMENSFTETIERIWNMCFDDPIINYELEDAIKKLESELGITKVIGEKVEYTVDGAKHDDGTLLSKLDALTDDKGKAQPNIEVVIKYFSYREINTDDLFTVIHELRDENLEVCALSFDYIKRIRPNVVALDSVKMELNRIINELKAMAVILDIPVITAHQMNRAAAATVDNAVRQGKGDVTKLVGRENTGDAWEIMETSDWVCVLNIEEKLGGDGGRYLVMNVVKRRRVDQSPGSLSNITYLAHPFAINNGLRLLDDLNLPKVLSLQSLSTDIDETIQKEKTNAVPRSKLEKREYIELDD